MKLVPASATSGKEVVIGAPWPENPFNQAFPGIPGKIFKPESIQKQLMDNVTSVNQDDDSTPKHVHDITQVIDDQDEASSIQANRSAVDTAAITIALKDQIQEILNHPQQAIINKAATAIMSTLSDDSPEQRVTYIHELLTTAISQTQEIAFFLTNLFGNTITNRIASPATLTSVVGYAQDTSPSNTSGDSLSSKPQDLADFIADAVNKFHS